jgi:hypothetical protein
MSMAASWGGGGGGGEGGNAVGVCFWCAFGERVARLVARLVCVRCWEFWIPRHAPSPPFCCVPSFPSPQTRAAPSPPPHPPPPNLSVAPRVPDGEPQRLFFYRLEHHGGGPPPLANDLGGIKGGGWACGLKRVRWGRGWAGGRGGVGSVGRAKGVRGRNRCGMQPRKRSKRSRRGSAADAHGGSNPNREQAETLGAKQRKRRANAGPPGRRRARAP